MDRYWSVENCRWEPSPARPELYWSVQRCRWEPVEQVTDALATPWSIFGTGEAPAAVPEQRRPQGAPVEA